MNERMPEPGGAVGRGAAAVLAAALAVPDAVALAEELAAAERAASRGYFLPDEDLAVRLRYSQD